jgi:hypothetical protein
MAPKLGPPFAPGLFHFTRRRPVAFVFNEGGRGFTLSIYRQPRGLRIYFAGRVWEWGIR